MIPVGVDQERSIRNAIILINYDGNHEISTEILGHYSYVK
jgi:hypothetical protein